MSKPITIKVSSPELRTSIGLAQHDFDRKMCTASIALHIKPYSLEIAYERNERQTVLRLLGGTQFDKQRTDRISKNPIKFHPFHLCIHPKRPGKDWQRVLEKIMTKVG